MSWNYRLCYLLLYLSIESLLLKLSSLLISTTNCKLPLSAHLANPIVMKMIFISLVRAETNPACSWLQVNILRASNCIWTRDPEQTILARSLIPFIRSSMITSLVWCSAETDWWSFPRASLHSKCVWNWWPRWNISLLKLWRLPDWHKISVWQHRHTLLLCAVDLMDRGKSYFKKPHHCMRLL